MTLAATIIGSTQMTEEPVEVIQADVDAAKPFKHPRQRFRNAESPSISERAAWERELDQAFARHRLSHSVEKQALIEALERLERIMRENIHENDGPDRIWIDGVPHEGAVAAWAIRCFRKVGEIARTALSKDNSNG